MSLDNIETALKQIKNFSRSFVVICGLKIINYLCVLRGAKKTQVHFFPPYDFHQKIEKISGFLVFFL